MSTTPQIGANTVVPPPISAASNAVALLRDKLDGDFGQFVEWFHDAGEAFLIVLNNAAKETEDA